VTKSEVRTYYYGAHHGREEGGDGGVIVVGKKKKQQGGRPRKSPLLRGSASSGSRSSEKGSRGTPGQEKTSENARGRGGWTTTMS